MAKFEIVSTFQDSNINLPARATKGAAGYDFEAAMDILIPSADYLMTWLPDRNTEVPLKEMKNIVKTIKAQPTLIPTGIKCKLESNEYLELCARSSFPLNYWLFLANGEGIIDADYYNNEGNEGHIMFQFINLSPYTLFIPKGEKIGQGIIRHYYLADNEQETNAPSEIRKGGFGSTG